MDHGRTRDVHDHANAALSNPIFLWGGRKRERLADALRTSEGPQEVGGKLTTFVGVQTQNRKVRAEMLAELATSTTDPVDQHLSDLTLAAQGEDSGVTRVVVNDQQEVTLKECEAPESSVKVCKASVGAVPERAHSTPPSAPGYLVTTRAAPPAPVPAAPTPAAPPAPAAPAAPVPPVRAPPGPAAPAAPAPAAPPAAPAPAAPPAAPAPAAPTAAPAPAAPPAAPAPAAPQAAPAPAAPPAAPAPAEPVARRQRRAYHSRSRCRERGSHCNRTPGEPPDAARAGSAPQDAVPPDSAPPGSTRSGSVPPDSTRSGSAPPVPAPVGSAPPGSAPPVPAPAGSAPLAAPESTATSTGSAGST
ncbi:unnamed protein product [Closterium sp. NIES-53]